MHPPGYRLHDRYRIEHRIGQGWQGTVYKAQDEQLEVAVAVKEALLDDEQARHNFQLEAQRLARLRHPLFPHIYAYFSEGTGQYLVMEYVDGPDLAERLMERGKPFDIVQVMAWADSLLDGLAYLHQRDIIHRDIKPSNLKLLPDGQIVLLDFGLAKGGMTQLAPSVPAFSLGYSPPEQMAGKSTDGRSDLYALAATLHALLTFKAPTDPVTRQSLIERGFPDPLEAAEQLNPQLPSAIAVHLARAMMLNPDDRFASAEAMRETLKQSMAATVVNSAPTPEIRQSKPQQSISEPIRHVPTELVKEKVEVSNEQLRYTEVKPSAEQLYPRSVRPSPSEHTPTTRDVPISPAKPPRRGWALPVGGVTLLLLICLACLAISTYQLVLQPAAQEREATTTAASRQAASATSAAVVRITLTAQAQASATARKEASATAAALAESTRTARRETAEAAIVQATANTVATSEALGRAAAGAELVFGPENGTLSHEEDGYIKDASANVSLRDFVVEATFINPYAASNHSWDYGFLLRDAGVNNQLRLSVESDNSWKMINRLNDESDVLASGYLVNLNLDGGEANEIRLVARDGQGVLYINGQFIALIDLSSRVNPGDILIATGIWQGNEVDGAATLYRNFTIRGIITAPTAPPGS